MSLQHIRRTLAGVFFSALALTSIGAVFFATDWVWRSLRPAQDTPVSWAERLIQYGIIYVLLLAILKTCYTWKKPRSMPANRPIFCFLPKYNHIVNLDHDLIHSANPQDDLSAILSSFGFRVFKKRSDQLSLVRGFELGDFSIKLAKVRLYFELPLTSQTRMSIEGGGRVFAPFFDNGDLWAFATELNDKITSCRDATNPSPQEETPNPHQ
jgi:hypothetical protein